MFSIFKNLISGTINFFNVNISYGDPKKEAAPKKSEVALNSPTIEMMGNRISKLNQLLMTGRHNRFTESDIARHLGMKSLAELQIQYHEDSIPFSLVDAYRDIFNVNPTWITDGTSSPFQTVMGFPQEMLTPFPRTDFGNGQIFLIRCRQKSSDMPSREGQVGLIVKESGTKYHIFRDSLHLNSDIGATGQKQILNFWYWLKALDPNKVHGYELDEGQFVEILSGEFYPAVLEEHSISQWPEDFKDVHHSFPISENYQDLYGKEFLYAQGIVRSQLK